MSGKKKVCKTCGAVVKKPERHRLWHKMNRPIPGPPGPPGPMGVSAPTGPPRQQPKSMNTDEIISAFQKFFGSPR